MYFLKDIWNIKNIWCVCAYVLSRVWHFVNPGTVSFQVLLSMGFFRQEYWNGLPFLSTGNLPDPGIKTTSPALADRFFTAKPLGKSKENHNYCFVQLLMCMWIQMCVTYVLNIYTYIHIYIIFHIYISYMWKIISGI